MSSLVNRRKVLVLNKSWNPCSVVSLRRALILLVKGDAEIVEVKFMEDEMSIRNITWADWADLIPHEEEEKIRTSRKKLKCPEIIVLHDYNKLPNQRLNFSRRALYRRDHNTCMYCGDTPGTEELTIDHILPKSMGGKSSWENCVLACVKCNSYKANRTPEQARMKFYNPDFKPFKPKFNLFKGDVRVDSWCAFLGSCYWDIPLEE